MNEPALRNVEQAAAWLGIPKKTLQNFVTARTVPFTKVGRHVRFTQAHLDAIVAAGEEPVAVAPTRFQIVASNTGPRPPAGPSPSSPPPGPKERGRTKSARNAA